MGSTISLENMQLWIGAVKAIFRWTLFSNENNFIEV